MVKEFVIATDTSNKSHLELHLFNLQMRLKIQEKQVERTKKDIEVIEELLRNQS